MKDATVFSPSSYKIFVVQLFCWITIAWFFTTAPNYWVLLGLLSYVLYAGMGVALTFHRTLSHNAFTFNPLIKKFLILLACMTNVGSPITWVAVHRAHHRHCDTERDPHSPQIYPWYYIMFGTMFSAVPVRYVPDLLRDKFLLFIHNYYYLLQLPWIVTLYLLGGWMAVVACHIVPGGMTWLAGSFVNYWNHKVGYKNFETNDTSTNSFLTGILVMGEGWHNNHHARGTLANNQVKAHEVDIVYYLGRLMGGVPKK